MANKLYEVLESRILLLDGGFGTMVQQYGFTEEDYRGERFRAMEFALAVVELLQGKDKVAELKEAMIV